MTTETVLITGHRGSLGYSFSQYMLEKGNKVIGFDSSISQDESSQENGLFREFKVDVTKQESIDSAVTKLQRLGTSIDSLVHFAAVNPTSDSLIRGHDLRSQSTSQIQTYLEVGTLGAVRVIQGLLDLFATQSSILLVGSDLSLISPNQNLYCECDRNNLDNHRSFCRVKPLAYSVDKAAILGLTRYLATLFATSEKAIRVNCVCIGAVNLNFTTEFEARISEQIPLGRPAQANEYNPLFHFLSSRQNSYMTGAIISCDGGRTSW